MTSFVIPAYNEAGLLGATIDAVHAAARALDEPYEIVDVQLMLTKAGNSSPLHGEPWGAGTSQRITAGSVSRCV